VPIAATTLDGDRILERQAGGGLALLPGVALNDRLPEVVATRVVETLRDAHIRASDERGTANVDYDLRLEIKDFAYDAEKRTVKVTFVAKMVGLGNGAVVASRMFSSGGAVDGSDPVAIVEALDQAFRRVLAALPPFVAAAIS
jgi:ABC-type uncharacterized transport system auxiliary subunit